MSSTFTCDATREHLSEYIDDRLDSTLRQKIEHHVDQCPHCRAERDALWLLGEHVRAVPAPDLAPGFAASVRAAAAPVRVARRASSPIWGRVAAAVVLAVTLGGTYFVGRQAGKSAAEEESGLPTSHGAIAALPARNEGERVRAAGELVSDLRFIDRVPSEMRSPLLRAEIDHFELAEWASRSMRRKRVHAVTRSVAHLIHRLDTALDTSVFQEELMELRDVARNIQLTGLPRLHQEMGQPSGDTVRRRRVRIISNVGGDLSDDMRGAISALLEMKESIIRGRHFDAASVYRNNNSVISIIGPAVEASMASAFGSDGLGEHARPYLHPLRSQDPELLELLAPVFGGHDAFKLQFGSGSFNMRVQEMFQEFGITGDVHIDMGAEHGGVHLSLTAPGKKQDRPKSGVRKVRRL